MAGLQGKGNRISKPPSAKQRAQAKRMSEKAVVIVPANTGMPSRSWWLDPNAWDHADAEQRRMRDSNFGRVHGNTTLES